MYYIWSVVLALVVLCPGLPVFGQTLKRPWIGVVVGVPVTGDVQPSADPLPYTGEVTRKFAFRSVAGVMVETPIISSRRSRPLQQGIAESAGSGGPVCDYATFTAARYVNAK